MTASSTEQPAAASQGAPKLHPNVLGCYRERGGCGQRELRCLHLPDGRRLIVDWRCDRRADARLVGELAADEPPENAAILASLYLDDPSDLRCRALRAHDLYGEMPRSSDHLTEELHKLLCDEHGATYELRTLGEDSYPELRWTCRLGPGELEPIRLRDVVGRLQTYEPVLALTRRALADHESRDGISICCLRAELQRVEQSPLLLNRRLREAVLERVESGLSLSEIAKRCGRTKRTKGACSGETSWLTRRIGVRPEHGEEDPTPWVHTDVLARIARDGLALAPLDVEAA